MGKTVAKPWITSRPTSSGMPCATLLHGDALQLVHRVDVHLVEDRADAPLAHGLAQVVREVTAGRVDLRHLADLLLERHRGEQRAHPLLDRAASGVDAATSRVSVVMPAR